MCTVIYLGAQRLDTLGRLSAALGYEPSAVTDAKKEINDFWASNGAAELPDADLSDFCLCQVDASRLAAEVGWELENFDGDLRVKSPNQSATPAVTYA